MDAGVFVKPPQEEREGMDARQGMTGAVRAVTVLFAVLALLVAAALAAPSRADAHQQAGRTLIYIDGDLVKNTADDHFVHERGLSSGCHRVEVVQRRGGEVISRSVRRFCSDERARLVVEVDDGSITTTTRTSS